MEIEDCELAIGVSFETEQRLTAHVYDFRLWGKALSVAEIASGRKVDSNPEHGAFDTIRDGTTYLKDWAFSVGELTNRFSKIVCNLVVAACCERVNSNMLRLLTALDEQTKLRARVYEGSFRRVLQVRYWYVSDYDNVLVR